MEGKFNYPPWLMRPRTSIVALVLLFFARSSVLGLPDRDSWYLGSRASSTWPEGHNQKLFCNRVSMYLCPHDLYSDEELGSQTISTLTTHSLTLWAPYRTNGRWIRLTWMNKTLQPCVRHHHHSKQKATQTPPLPAPQPKHRIIHSMSRARRLSE